jgi:ACGX-repeat protein
MHDIFVSINITDNGITNRKNIRRYKHMALSNILGWDKKEASSSCGGSCGAGVKPAEAPAACGAGDKPAEAPAACGAGDKPAEAPAACGASDK